jgi:hypothetical protein
MCRRRRRLGIGRMSVEPMKKLFTDGWARIWLVISLALTVSLVVIGLDKTEKPSDSALNITFNQSVVDQMDNPACAPLLMATPRTISNLLTEELGQECYSLLWYRVQFGALLDRTYARINIYDAQQLPNDAAWYQKHTWVIRDQAWIDLRDYHRNVFIHPLLSFISSWLLFVFIRLTKRWVQAGFNKN